MNAKFEKCWSQYESPVGDPKFAKRVATDFWQASIQSIEVTPELVSMAEAARCNALGVALDPQPALRTMRTESMHAALTAVLSALKEQAK